MNLQRCTYIRNVRTNESWLRLVGLLGKERELF